MDIYDIICKGLLTTKLIYRYRYSKIYPDSAYRYCSKSKTSENTYKCSFSISKFGGKPVSLSGYLHENKLKNIRCSRSGIKFVGVGNIERTKSMCSNDFKRW